MKFSETPTIRRPSYYIPDDGQDYVID